MIVGNWKMNQTPKKALKFIQELKSLNPKFFTVSKPTRRIKALLHH